MPDDDEDPEPVRVRLWRYQQAREQGLTMVEARMFADTDDCDLETLRKLRAKGCPAQLAAKIVL